MKINYWSHACVQVSNDLSFLFDPWLLQQPVYNLTTWKYPDLPSSGLESFVNSDVYILTHSHEDHFHVPSLNLLDRHKPFVIPRFNEVTSPRIKLIHNILTTFQFDNIIELGPWEDYYFSKTRIVRIPSAGSRIHDWENSSYLIEDLSSNTSILNMNDNVSDEKLINEILIRFGTIDCLMIQAGGVTMYPGLFKMTSEKMLTEAKRRRTDLTDQRRQIKLISPKFVVPFAADFCWLDPKLFHCNYTNRSDPENFLLMLDEINYDGIPIILKPGDSWLVGDKTWSADYLDWDQRSENLVHMQSKYKVQLQAINEYLDPDLSIDLKSCTIDRVRLQLEHIDGSDIDFTATIAIQINKQDDFQFVVIYKFTHCSLHAFVADVLPDDVDIILHISSNIWNSVITGRLMQNIIQWSGVHEHITPFRPDIAKAWYWLEYHIDLNNKNIQCHFNSTLVRNYIDKSLDVNRGVV